MLLVRERITPATIHNSEIALSTTSVSSPHESRLVLIVSTSYFIISHSLPLDPFYTCSPKNIRLPMIRSVLPVQTSSLDLSALLPTPIFYGLQRSGTRSK